MENRNVTAERLKDLSEKYNTNSRQIALSIGVDPSYMAKAFKGKTGLTVEKLESIADLYNEDVMWLRAADNVPHGTNAANMANEPNADYGGPFISWSGKLETFLKTNNMSPKQFSQKTKLNDLTVEDLLKSDVPPPNDILEKIRAAAGPENAKYFIEENIQVNFNKHGKQITSNKGNTNVSKSNELREFLNFALKMNDSLLKNNETLQLIIMDYRKMINV